MVASHLVSRGFQQPSPGSEGSAPHLSRGHSRKEDPDAGALAPLRRRSNGWRQGPTLSLPLSPCMADGLQHWMSPSNS